MPVVNREPWYGPKSIGRSPPPIAPRCHKIGAGARAKERAAGAERNCIRPLNASAPVSGGLLSAHCEVLDVPEPVSN